ncbi:MAG TPA: sugar phosphate isomerase/epimerase, partial [Hyphomicrobiaceae bacterium]|nr:sugar phosphate isomerase/epimerase [Hyphomicrobiaceae bacterium]
MRDFSRGAAHLSINTATLRKQLDLPGIIEACAALGIRTICPWRDQVQAAGHDRVARHISDTGVTLSGDCRGGVYTA